jgi:hypothetical protein
MLNDGGNEVVRSDGAAMDRGMYLTQVVQIVGFVTTTSGALFK